MSRSTKPAVLIDGDLMLYRAAAACERPTNWGDGVWTLHSNENEVKAAATAMASRVLDAVRLIFGQPGSIYIAISDGDNWRRELMPSYKANRDGTRKPLIFAQLRDEWAKSGALGQYVVYPRLEADDVIGIAATTLGDQSVIVTDDKDLRQIPGRHIKLSDPRTATSTVVDPWKGFIWHMAQTLIGDTTDNYPGCPGMGHARTEKLLAPFVNADASKADVWQAVVRAFEQKKLTEEDALLQARVAYILQAGDYNKETKEVKLWHPTTSQ